MPCAGKNSVHVFVVMVFLAELHSTSDTAYTATAMELNAHLLVVVMVVAQQSRSREVGSV